MDVFELRKEAQEKLNLTDAQADAFVAGFIKEAATPFDPLENRGQDSGSSITERAAGKFLSEGVGSLGKAIGGGIGSLAVNGVLQGVAGLVSSAQNAALYRKFTESLKTVMESNRIIRNADRNKVLSYADTIYKFAPHVASDVNLLSQILANAIHGEGVDPSTIESITRLEERYGSSGRGSFRAKDFT